MKAEDQENLNIKKTMPEIGLDGASYELRALR